MKMRLPVAREGFAPVKLFFSLTLAFYVIGYAFWPLYVLSGISFLLVIFTIYFFRDPERKITEGKNLILSPADGKILDIKKQDHEFMGLGSQVIKIFMSPLNMHVQRSPVNGTVALVKYQPGLFLRAYEQEADEKNEQNIIAIEADFADIGVKSSVRIVVKQIAGIIARRVICRAKEKDTLVKGQRIGLIKFGSQVDIYLPENIELKVKKGDKVKAGISIIGEVSQILLS
jgi:phosphatidylserine decarboxylase